MQPGLASDRIASARPTLSNTRQAAQRRCTTQTRKVSIPSGFFYALRVGIFGAVPVPMFGLLLFRCSASAHALRVGLLVGGPLPVGGPVCCRHALRYALLLLLSLSASYAHRLRSPLPIPSMPRLFCGLPGVLPYPGQCALALRYQCTQTGETGTGLATALRSVFGRLPSSAPALTPCTCSANALPTLRTRSAGPRYAVSGIARAKARATGTGNATGKGNGKPSVPSRPGAIYVWCSAQKIHIGK